MRIKYMGTADERIIPAGETAGGTLPEPITVDVVWNRANSWAVDTEDPKLASVPAELWEYILANDSFENVSDYRRIPLNDHQRIFLALKDGEQKTLEQEEQDEADALALLEEERLLRVADSNAEIEEGSEEQSHRARLQGSSKQELVDRAIELNIEGAESMSKTKLFDAVEAAQSA